MCGISGIASTSNISKKLTGSIQSLEYRGYDSCGIALLNGKETVVKKNIGYVADVAEKENFISVTGKVGIAHTRWATHGGVTELNAHPHTSCDGKIAVVHNGIISNYQKLKSLLVQKGHKFKSKTDSEVIAHLIEESQNRGHTIEEAFLSALRKLEGTFAVALLSSDEPEKIFCGKSESPLILGLGTNENYIGSDFNAFIDFTKRAVVLDDGEYAVVSNENHVIRKIADGSPVSKELTIIEWDAEMAQKGGFPHYMLKEIYEVPDTITKAMSIPKQDVCSVAQKLIEAKNSYMAGVGTTYYCVLLGQYYMARYAGVMAHAISSDEALESAPVGKGDYLLAISQSGETYDTLRAIKSAIKNGANTASIVNVIGSTMARLTDQTVMQGAGPEICVVSTKVAIAQMVTLMRIALEAGIITGKLKTPQKKILEKEFEKLPSIISDFLNEYSGFAHSLAQRQAEHKSWLYLGRGIYYPVALESALKVKEVAYQHAEGMPAGFLKHGTIALIDDHVRSLVFVPPTREKELYQLTLGAIEEIKTRGGKVVAFHSSKSLQKSNLLDDQLLLPSVHPFIAPILSLVAGQLYSYFCATTLGRNVDKPRSLAKSVTVA